MRRVQTATFVALLPVLIASTDAVEAPPFPKTREGLERFLSQLESVIDSQLAEFKQTLPGDAYEVLQADHERWVETRRNACASSESGEEADLAELRCLVLKSETYFHEREIQLGEILDPFVEETSP